MKDLEDMEERHKKEGESRMQPPSLQTFLFFWNLGTHVSCATVCSCPCLLHTGAAGKEEGEEEDHSAASSPPTSATSSSAATSDAGSHQAEEGEADSQAHLEGGGGEVLSAALCPSLLALPSLAPLSLE